MGRMQTFPGDGSGGLMTEEEWNEHLEQSARELPERDPALWASAQNAMANREEWEAEACAEAQRSQAKLALRSKAMRAQEDLEMAEVEMHLAQCYARRGELLRQAHAWPREDQHCEKCGHRFNYDVNGEPKKQPDWCDPRKRLCDDEGNGNPFCVAMQAKQKRAKKQLKSKNKPARKPVNGHSATSQSSRRGATTRASVQDPSI